jgi:hypothetical protein
LDPSEVIPWVLFVVVPFTFFAILGCSAILFVLYSLFFCYTWVLSHFEHMIFKWVKVNSVWTHPLWTWSVHIQTNLGSPTKFSGAFFVTLLWTPCGIWTIPHYGSWADACFGWSSKFLLNIESTPIQLVAWNNPFKLRLYMMKRWQAW